MIADDTTSGEEYSSDLSDSDDQVRDPHADDLPEPIGSVTAAKQKKKKKPKKKIELPDMTDPEKQHFLKDVRRATKKVKTFAVQKATRKLKQQQNEKASKVTLQNIEEDLKIYKKLDAGQLAVYAWTVMFDKKKVGFCNKESAREKELINLLLRQQAVKKAFEVVNKKRVRKVKRKAYLDKVKNEKKASGKKAKPDQEESQNDGKKKTGLDLLTLNEVVEGLVDGVESFGIFVDFFVREQLFRGMCHISEISEKRVKNIERMFAVGDMVKAVVIKIDKVNNKVSLGMKRSQFPREKLWLPPKRQQNRSNRHSNGKDLQHKTEDNVFVPTLSSGSLEESDSALAAQRARKNELMVKLKMAKTKDGSKRLGQRARQKLYEELFAANANHKTGVSGTGVGSQGGQVQGRKRKRQAPGPGGASKKQNSGVSSGSQECDQPEEPVRKPAAKSELPKAQVQQHQTSSDPSLHPSWAAKQAASANVAFAGKKVKL